jgi:hypothetical protein
LSLCVEIGLKAEYFSLIKHQSEAITSIQVQSAFCPTQLNSHAFEVLGRGKQLSWVYLLKGI